MLQKVWPRALQPSDCATEGLKVRMLKAEVLETLLYGWMTWTLGREHYAKLWTVHHQPLLRTIGFSRRQRSDHVLSYPKALKKTQCESVETIVRNWRLLFAGTVARNTTDDYYTTSGDVRLAIRGGEIRNQADQRRIGCNAYRTTSRRFEPLTALVKTPRQIL